MGGRQIAVDLSGLADQVNSSKATQTRLIYHKGEVVFEPRTRSGCGGRSGRCQRDHRDSPFSAQRAHTLAPKKTLQQERWYAGETAVKSTGSPIETSVVLSEPGKVKKARLLIGVHRSGGLTGPLQVSVNGNEISVDSGDAAEFSEFFAPTGCGPSCGSAEKGKCCDDQGAGKHYDYVGADSHPKLDGLVRRISVGWIA